MVKQKNGHAVYKPQDRSRARWKKLDGGREWRLFEWQREMDVKIGFWEIMNLHILIEKSMLSTKKKKIPQLIFRITKCVQPDCIVYMDVIERSFEWTITDLHFEGSSPLRLSSVIKIDEWVILYQMPFLFEHFEELFTQKSQRIWGN